MKTDINFKMATNINNLKKNQKQIVIDERRNMRQMD
jgi:hypothetical protein